MLKRPIRRETCEFCEIRARTLPELTPQPRPYSRPSEDTSDGRVVCVRDRALRTLILRLSVLARSIRRRRKSLALTDFPGSPPYPPCSAIFRRHDCCA